MNLISKNNVLHAVTGLVASLLLVCFTGVQAKTVKLQGENVDFFYNDNQPSLQYYGTPMVVDDNLILLPDELRAESIDGVGVHSGTNTDTLVNTFTFRVRGKSWKTIFENILFEEVGTYRTFGTGAEVDVDGALLVVDYNDPVFGAYDSDSLIPSDLSHTNGNVDNWSADTDIDMTEEQWNGLRDFQVTITNIIEATSPGVFKHAWIQKNVVSVTISTRQWNWQQDHWTNR